VFEGEKEMTFPENVRTHQIVDYWYCCERSRLMACLGLEAPDSEVLEEGSKVHNWLEKRPKTKREMELYEKLKAYQPFTRVLNGTKIVGHPDDLTLLGKNKVQIIEYKTVSKPNVKPWKSALAKTQLRIYVWILEPTLEDLGYQIAYYHHVIVLKRNGIFFKKFTVESDNYCVERQIREVFRFWKNGKPLISPLKWKCNMCSSVFKSRCRIWKVKRRGESHA
jgi:CRISPR/Cas system-associated exonuclease Cas4 (RecB family)